MYNSILSRLHVHDFFLSFFQAQCRPSLSAVQNSNKSSMMEKDLRHSSPSPRGPCNQACGARALDLTVATLGPAEASGEQAPGQEGNTSEGKGETPQRWHGLCLALGSLAPARRTLNSSAQGGGVKGLV